MGYRNIITICTCRFFTQLRIDIMTILTLGGYFFPLTSSELGYVEDEIFKKRQENEVSTVVPNPCKLLCACLNKTGWHKIALEKC